MQLRNPRRLAAGVVAGAVIGAVTTAAPAAADPNNNSPRKLVKAVTLEGVMQHVRAFQAHADAAGSNDTRAASTPGYQLSSQYVHDKLAAAGYDVRFQDFPFLFTQEAEESLQVLSPAARSIAVDVMTYSPATPPGGLTAPVAVVPEDAGTGCEASDFASRSYTGTIALIRRGTCSFAQKAQNAAAAGAVGAIVSNNDTVSPDAVTNGTLGTPDAVRIPVGGISYNDGTRLATEARAGTVTVNLRLHEVREQRRTRNVIAQTREGRTDNVVMAGAHLDSVTEGPGINDNGSGSAALLETALQMSKVKPNNAVRFTWWSAEEFGLLGSRYYVDQLPEAERDKIALYLNFDMVGSPNYFRGIYDGDDSDKVGAGAGPAGSAEIEKVFEGYFAQEKLPFEGTDFSGRSDYGPFIAVGIPSGGLFTGAEGIKTAEQAARYGGVAGKAYDPCYHQACDSMTPVADGGDAALYAQLDREYNLRGNVNPRALDTNADAIAWTVSTFSWDTSAVNGVRSPGKSHGKPTPKFDGDHGDRHHPKDEAA